MKTYKEYMGEMWSEIKTDFKHDDDAAKELAGMVTAFTVIIILAGVVSVGFMTWAPLLFVLACIGTFMVLFAVVSVVYISAIWLFEEKLGN